MISNGSPMSSKVVMPLDSASSPARRIALRRWARSEEHTSELQSRGHLVGGRGPPAFPTRRSSDLGDMRRERLIRLVVDQRVQPERQLALLREPPVEVDDLERLTHVFEGGDALGQRVFAGEANRLAPVGKIGRAHV